MYILGFLAAAALATPEGPTTKPPKTEEPVAEERQLRAYAAIVAGAPYLEALEVGFSGGPLTVNAGRSLPFPCTYWRVGLLAHNKDHQWFGVMGGHFRGIPLLWNVLGYDLLGRPVYEPLARGYMAELSVEMPILNSTTKKPTVWGIRLTLGGTYYQSIDAYDQSWIPNPIGSLALTLTSRD